MRPAFSVRAGTVPLSSDSTMKASRERAANNLAVRAALAAPSS